MVFEALLAHLCGMQHMAGAGISQQGKQGAEWTTGSRANDRTRKLMGTGIGDIDVEEVIYLAQCASNFHLNVQSPEISEQLRDCAALPLTTLPQLPHPPCPVHQWLPPWRAVS